MLCPPLPHPAPKTMLPLGTRIGHLNLCSIAIYPNSFYDCIYREADCTPAPALNTVTHLLGSSLYLSVYDLPTPV